jgi:hypothetical protein
MNTNKDKEFKNVENLKWLPFVGQNFFNSPNENKMLIVGESHYHDKSEESILKHDNPLYTRIVINELAIGRSYWDTRIFQNFHKTLFSNDSFDTNVFWNLVSYYNFIQRPMETNKGRPSNKEFYESWKTFFNVVQILKPKVCLFIGNTSADQLLKSIPNSGFTCKSVNWLDKINGAYAKVATIQDEKNNEIKLIFIKHTSQRYTSQKWNVFLNKTIENELDWFQEKISIK